MNYFHLQRQWILLLFLSTFFFVDSVLWSQTQQTASDAVSTRSEVASTRSEVVSTRSDAISTTVPAQSEPVCVTILHTNDEHGHLLPEEGLGGLARRVSLIRRIRSEREKVFLVDAGDINTGTPVSDFFKALPDILAYNRLGYDFVTFGNHEFDAPISRLEEQIRMAKFSFLSANVCRPNGSYIGLPWTVQEYKGVRIGFFGLTPSSDQIIVPRPLEFKILPELETARRTVELLKRQERADLVIALVHLGFNDSVPGQFSSIRLAESVPQLDLVIDGHSHAVINKPRIVGSVPIVTAGCWGRYLGQADLTIQNRPSPVNSDRNEAQSLSNLPSQQDRKTEDFNDRPKKIVKLNWRCIPIDRSIVPDSETEKFLSPFLKKIQKEYGSIVTETAEVFVHDGYPCRHQETALADLICDGMARKLELLDLSTDFSFLTGGNIRAGFPKGPITMERILEVLPFNNRLVRLTLKGSDVLELFRIIAAAKPGSGAFAQVSSSARYTIEYDEKGKGHLAGPPRIAGKEIDPNRTYRIGTSDYLADGGDGYFILKNSLEQIRTDYRIHDAFAEYLKTLPTPIRQRTDGRIVIKPFQSNDKH